VLAFVAAVGVVAGAIGSVIALLPKSSDVLDASFSGVTAYPGVSLEQYDARSSSNGIVGGSSIPVKTGMIVYRLAADTTSLPEVSSIPQGATSGSTTSTSTTTTSPAQTTTANPTQTTSTSTTPTRTSTSRTSTGPSKPGKTVEQRGVKRKGGGAATVDPERSYPTGKPAERQIPISTPPPRQSFRPVHGALISEGTGTPTGKVAAVVKALSSVRTPEPEGSATTPEGEDQTSTSPTSTSTTSAPAPTETAPGGTTGEPTASARVVLPETCRSLCGATQEIEKALTYDPNPVKAAEAVAAVFHDSRASVVGRRLYPIGAMVSYTVELDGFAHRKATLEWSLLSIESGQSPPRPWWRDVIVAHIEPTINRESLSGQFWVPVPPQRGDYLVHLVLSDATGVPRATSDSTPAFH
jgi:hypothetical protein